jgi:hypothetical protein|tara:strand:+ start:23 stop:397 length:375 start_codon:yes stop_codon:yes gene_type:complete
MDKISLNLPAKVSNKEDDVKRYFNTYYQKQTAYPSNEVDAVIGFLESKGFGTSAAQSTGAVLLQQAKTDGVKVFELLDTLKGLEKLQLSYAVASVINFNREKISTMGFRVVNTTNAVESRNIMG